MANKDANSGSITIDKPSMAFAVASLQLSSRQIDAERATLVELKKQLITMSASTWRSISRRSTPRRRTA